MKFIKELPANTELVAVPSTGPCLPIGSRLLFKLGRDIYKYCKDV